MSSDLLMLSVVIGQLLILFVWTESFRVCVDNDTISYRSILSLYAPLILRLWKHDLLFYMVLKNV